jgi:hypothetical protein
MLKFPMNGGHALNFRELNPPIDLIPASLSKIKDNEMVLSRF